MRVGIDVTYAAKREGTGTYIRSLVNALARHPEIEIITFARPRLTFLHLLPRPLARLAKGIFSIVWLQVIVPIRAAQQRIDVFHAPAFIAPLLLPCPLVLTIHDVVPFVLGQRSYRLWGLYMRLFVGLSAQRARCVIAVSTHAAGELANVFNLPQGKIRAIPHGVSPQFRPLSAQETVPYDSSITEQPFLLFVGASDERKNYTTLLTALHTLRGGGLIVPPLLVTGNPTAEFRALAARVNKAGMEPIRFLGFVSEEALVALYNRASTFIFPSRYEGFGLPVLEAMACGCPVICSNTTSLPEVAGDAALLIDPEDPLALATAIKAMLTDQDTRERFVKVGLEHARAFTWKRTAEQTLAIYHDVA